MKSVAIKSVALLLSATVLVACSSNDQEERAGPSDNVTNDNPTEHQSSPGNGGDSSSDDENDTGGGGLNLDEDYTVTIVATPASTNPPQGFDGTRGIEGNTAFDENGEFREFSEDEMDDVDEIIQGLLAQPNEPSASCTGVETMTITISQNDILHHEETVGACQDGPEYEIVSSLYMTLGSY